MLNYPLLGAKESSSSKKIIHGAFRFAFKKISRMFFSLSPMYMFNNSGPLTERKFILHSVAIHFARRVFPVPGGPKNKIPVLGRTKSSKIFGYIWGSIIVSSISSFASYRPPTSSQFTLGIDKVSISFDFFT